MPTLWTTPWTAWTMQLADVSCRGNRLPVLAWCMSCKIGAPDAWQAHDCSASHDACILCWMAHCAPWRMGRMLPSGGATAVWRHDLQQAPLYILEQLAHVSTSVRWSRTCLQQ